MDGVAESIKVAVCSSINPSQQNEQNIIELQADNDTVLLKHN